MVKSKKKFYEKMLPTPQCTPCTLNIAPILNYLFPLGHSSPKYPTLLPLFPTL